MAKWLLLLALACCRSAAGEGDAVDEIKSKLDEVGINSQAKRAAVGGVAGFLGGYLLKQSENVVINSALVGSACVAGACYAGWVTPEQLIDKANEVAEVSSNFFGLTGLLYGKDAEEAPPPKPSKSKIMISNVVKRLPGLLGGGAIGALVGYRLG